LSPPSAISLDGLDLPKGESEDAYHFIVYVPVGDTLFELDGLKRHPVNHGEISGDISISWLEKALDVIQRRIEMYPPGAVRILILKNGTVTHPIFIGRIQLASTSSGSIAHLNLA
jgi:ubiquitin carboxyl-terminal hydrolase L5